MPIARHWVAVGFAVALSGCGSDSSEPTKRTAQEPRSVAAAETAVRQRVDALLGSSREKYPDDAQVVPEGGASCKPFSEFQLDCTQTVRDDTNPWTGVTKWRATVDQSTGRVTINEHGGKTLAAMLDDRSRCLAAGVACE